MPRTPGELSVDQAADLAGVHRVTIIKWARAAIAGETSRCSSARQDSSRRIWVIISGACDDARSEAMRMSKRDDEYSTREAAHRLGVHQRTIINWATASLADERSLFRKDALRRDLVGRFFVQKTEVARLIKEHKAATLRSG